MRSHKRLKAEICSAKQKGCISDFKYTKDWILNREEMDYDQELGMMRSQTLGTWVRLGTSWMDSDRNFSILLGFRLIQ
jgi:hypothetical protein